MRISDCGLVVDFDFGGSQASPWLSPIIPQAKTRHAPVHAALVVGCDGIHSAIRKQLYPNDGAPRYSGVNMWRGSVVMKPFLSGATMVRAGWLSVGKMVIYPIRDNVDGKGNQLINWGAEIEADQPAKRDWTGRGKLEDFFPAFADWHFDWLDVGAMIKSTETILEYPMVDQDPLPRWSFGRVTLLAMPLTRWCRVARTARARRSWMRLAWSSSCASSACPPKR